VPSTIACTSRSRSPNDAGELLLLRGSCALGIAAQPVGLGGELLAEDGEELRVHQAARQRIEHPALQGVAGDGAAVAAGALVARGGAAEMRGRYHRHAAAAGAAMESRP
jgi:hypothetical protein